MTSPRVTPGQSLSPQQKTGLELVAGLHGGRDVVLAIDLTESVGLNDEGRIRLRQIVEDSLKPGDSVYVVPFASDVAPLKDASNLHPLGTPIEFSSKTKDNIDKILQKIPFEPNLRLKKTDIQQAELTIYQGIAQINQNRLQQNKPIKPQSVVWITDAPLFTKSPADSNDWIETPADSSFRVENSPESQQRQAWIQVLPIKRRSRSITTNENKQYKLTVVDVAPTVQEFCTPAPGGRETCLVTPYLIKQLWLPTSVSIIVLIALLVAINKWMSLHKDWKLIVKYESDQERKKQEKISLAHNKTIAIGRSGTNSIYCPGSEVRGHLKREGNKLYLVPIKNSASIYYKDKEITKRTSIERSNFRINCPDKGLDYEINIELKK